MTNPDAVAALMAREEYADAAYDHIRSLDPETDIARLAEIEARGDLRDERRRGGDSSVACVRRPTPARRGVARFDAVPDMADAWRRLQRGEARSEDLDLLRHELFEARYETTHGSTYREAHAAAIDAGYTRDPPQWME